MNLTSLRLADGFGLEASIIAMFTARVYAASR